MSPIFSLTSIYSGFLFVFKKLQIDSVLIFPVLNIASNIVYLIVFSLLLLLLLTSLITELLLVWK